MPKVNCWEQKSSGMQQGGRKSCAFMNLVRQEEEPTAFGSSHTRQDPRKTACGACL